MPRRTLYPALEPFDSGYLSVSGLHEIYYEQCGNPRGKPAVFLHGGPGGGGDATPRRFFDPARYRIVLLDQRGCGRSRPARRASRKHHLGPHRRHRGAPRETGHRALAGVRRLLGQHAVAPLRRDPSGAGDRTGPPRHLPAAARGDRLVLPAGRQRSLPRRLGALPGLHPGRRAPRHAPRLSQAPDRPGSRRWPSRQPAAGPSGKGARATCWPSASTVERFGADHFALAFARIEAHYFVNQAFMEAPDQILRDVGRIRHIPAVIVQGRYDVVCPMRSAWDLHRAWPEADPANRAGRGPFGLRARASCTN